MIDIRLKLVFAIIIISTLTLGFFHYLPLEYKIFCAIPSFIGGVWITKIVK